MQRIDNVPDRTAILKYYEATASLPGFQAKMYQAHHRRQTWQRVQDLLSLVLPFTPDVLEVGCADGLVSQWIAPRVTELQGIDIVPGCIYRCIDLDLDNAIFGIMDAADIGKMDSDFDLIIAMDVIEHLQDPLAFIEVAREKAGALFVTTPINEQPNERAFDVDAYKEPRAIGDGSGHIWSFDASTFAGLFDEVWWYEDNGVTAIILGR